MSVNKCKISGCTNPIKLNPDGTAKLIRGYCNRHYAKLMKDRCYNPTTEGYKDYGERGIKVCDRWLGLRGFDAFCEDMGKRPSKKHSIDRIDVNGDYTPNNCRWATMKQQCRNRRDSVYITYKGEKRLFIELCEDLGLNYQTIKRRVHYLGWDIDTALTKPIGEYDKVLLFRREQATFDTMMEKLNKKVAISHLLEKHNYKNIHDLFHTISKIRRVTDYTVTKISTTHYILKSKEK